MKTSEVKTSSVISNERFPMAKIDVEGIIVEFTVYNMHEDHREWLMGILKDRFAEVYASAYNKAISNVNGAIHNYMKVCGMKEIF